MASIESVEKLNDLRTYLPFPSDGDVLYVKYHSSPSDGGGGFFQFIAAVANKDDNDGTIVKHDTTNPNSPGRWIRQYDSYINVKFFGCTGNLQPDDGDRIQAAIDYAADNIVYNAYTKGNTVYIPCGNYKIHKPLVLKDGVSITGDSMSMTFLMAGYPDELSHRYSTYDGYMFVMAPGRVTGCNVSNLCFHGAVETGETFDPASQDIKTKGCMHLEARVDGPYNDGGLWNCTFKNIRIRNFNGHGIYLDGGGAGDYEYSAPNQLLVFENVYVSRQKNVSHSLAMQGEQGQVTFLNCGFSGMTYYKSGKYHALKGMNVIITNKKYVQTAVVSFINSTFESSEYGVYIRAAESITFDTCWFETLDMGLTAVGYIDDSDEKPVYISKAINVINSRFANAAGFGSLNIEKNPSPGRCITVTAAEVNAYNNYVTVTEVNAAALNSLFILGLPLGQGVSNFGVRTMGNSFQDNRLGYSSGIKQEIPIESNRINLRDNKIVYVTGTENNPPVREIECSVSAGETLTIRAAAFPVKFATTGGNSNIFLSGKSSITIGVGDIATFVKIDSNTSATETYQLISLYKSNSAV